MLLPTDPRWGTRRLRRLVLRAELANPANQNATEFVELLVDLTLVHSIVPTAILQRLGISPWSERDFLLANGSTVRRKLAGVLMKHHGDIAMVNVIFGGEGDSPRVGTLALEALGFLFSNATKRP